MGFISIVKGEWKCPNCNKKITEKELKKLPIRGAGLGRNHIVWSCGNCKTIIQITH